ncbi:uncharacterized protein DDB_G0280315-like [Paramacrobiotus metropolitanus]|uniref:uncharacterized protein DDB_G0280315-like n=1 Tax=Paramacrobiotus metropolitanus TaxID=2943436 RepID=UPI002445BA6E|nr:uncharacterized protein DDB_G0280315-like [Paramacrobiotus metropolitanus]
MKRDIHKLDPTFVQCQSASIMESESCPQLNYVTFFILSVVVSVVQCQPSSGGSSSSSGSIINGTVFLNNGATSGVINNQFQSQATSFNSASGISAVVIGSASTNGDFAPSNFDMNNANIYANSGSNSNGNGQTGSVSNLDHSNTSSANGLAVIGQSQIVGTGTGLNLNSNANANSYAESSNVADTGKGISPYTSRSLHTNNIRQKPDASLGAKRTRNTNYHSTNVLKSRQKPRCLEC